MSNNSTNVDIQTMLENRKKDDKKLLQEFCTIHTTLSTQLNKLRDQKMNQENVDSWNRLTQSLDICGNRISLLG